MHFDNIFTSFLDAISRLLLEIILHQSATDVRIALEVEKALRIHRHKAFEQLLVAIKELVVDLDVVAPYNTLALLLRVVVRYKIRLAQHALLVLFFAASVDQGHSQDVVHVAGLLVSLDTLGNLVAEQGDPLANLLIRLVMDLVNQVKRGLRVLITNDRRDVLAVSSGIYAG